MRSIAIFYAFGMAFLTTCWAADPPQRAKPPAWSQDVLDVFFEDAREHLAGQRPEETTPANTTGQEISTPHAGEAKRKPAELSTLSPEVLANEIKRIHNHLAVALRKANDFRSGRNIDCRQDFGMLALLFDEMAKRKDLTSWQSSTSLMQWRCRQAEVACRQASDESYVAAKQVFQLLDDLLRGQTLREKQPPSKTKLVPINRDLLMQRMELAVEAKIRPALANKKTFRKADREVVHQAEMLAWLAEQITRPHYEYGDDETFGEYATELRQASIEIAEGAQQRDYARTRMAEGRAAQSCSQCHEGYRG